MTKKTTLETKTKFPYWETCATYYGRVKKTFEDSLPSLDCGTILDWGCSEGLTTHEIEELYPSARVTGIDINPVQIKKARERGISSRFLIEDGYDNSFSDESFDLVFCMNNLIFALLGKRESEYREMLSPITRLVKPQGYLLVSQMYSHVVLQKNEEDFSLIFDKEVPFIQNPLSQVSFILTGSYPEIVPWFGRNTNGPHTDHCEPRQDGLQGHTDLLNYSHLKDYKISSTILRPYLVESINRIMGKDNGDDVK